MITQERLQEVIQFKGQRLTLIFRFGAVRTEDLAVTALKKDRFPVLQQSSTGNAAGKIRAISVFTGQLGPEQERKLSRNSVFLIQYEQCSVQDMKDPLGVAMTDVSGFQKFQAVYSHPQPGQILMQPGEPVQEGTFVEDEVVTVFAGRDLKPDMIELVQAAGEASPALAASKGKTGHNAPGWRKKTDPTVDLPKDAYFEDNNLFSKLLPAHGRSRFPHLTATMSL